MPILPIVLSAAGNTLTLVVVALLLRDARQILTARIAVPLFLASIGYSLILLHGTLRLPLPVLQAAVVVNAFSLGLGWLFGQALLQDGFRIGRKDWAVFAAISLLVLTADADVFGMAWPGHRAVESAAFLTSLAVMIHLFWIAVSGFQDDLVDIRRLVRIWFILFVLLSYLLLIVLELAGVPVLWRSLVYDGATVTINVSILWWLAELRVDRVSLEPRQERAGPASMTPRDAQAYRRLLTAMQEEHAYREPGLSVRALAERVKLPEHRLRALINGTLGHRNFAAFLNDYRLAAARVALSDAELADRPILTIAMDCGYQSLSTFNRAFKSRYNETPSTFRSRALTGAHDGIVPPRAD